MDTCGNPSFAAAKIVALSSDQNLIRPPEAEHECGDVSFAGRIPLIDTDVVIIKYVLISLDLHLR